jgi:serine/threonine-protein kinase|nr:protein kinase [Kofleriaceae bacterium]
MGTALVQPHQRLGRYELLARLASGGMGEIFLARLEGAAGFEKLFVIKRVLPHLADDVRFRQMLISEARIASKLSHGNICQVYELGDADGQLYIVMEYLEGVTLLPVLRRASREHEPLDLGLVGAVIQQVSDALHYAHDLTERDGSPLGLVHRDVTPSNVFVTDSGIVKVLDFGIAKAKGASASQTQTGAVKGKYAYMAPEQLRGATDIDRRVDVFALGISLFEMLALRRLFQRKTDYLTFRAVMEQPIPDVRQYRPEISEGLAAVVAKALERDPANRYVSARQLATAALDALAADGRRPWSQGEVGDFIRGAFKGDLGKRSQDVATAVHHTEVAEPGMGRTTMPLIVTRDEPQEPADDEDPEFLPVETALDPAPPAPTASQAMRALHAPSRADTTPPPFGLESTASGPALRPIAAPPVRAPRSLLWPIVAGGMFVVAGGALVLVWQMTQKSTPPTSVVISTPDDTHVDSKGQVVVTPGSAGGSATVDAPGSAAATTVQTPAQHPHPRRSPYDQVIDARIPQLSACMRDHHEPTAPTAAKLHIDTAGRPTAVSLQPAALDATPLGACLAGVLRAARFPSAPNESDLTVPLHVK